MGQLPWEHTPGIRLDIFYEPTKTVYYSARLKTGTLIERTREIPVAW